MFFLNFEEALNCIFSYIYHGGIDITAITLTKQQYYQLKCQVSRKSLKNVDVDDEIVFHTPYGKVAIYSDEQ